MGVSDKRKFLATICVKFGTHRTRIELAPAELHGGPAGHYRVRVGRRWRDLPEGGQAWLSPADVGALVAEMLGGGEHLPPEPDLPRGSQVSVPDGRYDLLGEPLRTLTRTATAPVRLYGGQWCVGVCVYGRGIVMVPVNDCIRR